MRLVDVRSFDGPNVYCHRPVVRMTLSLGEHTRRTTRDFPGFASELLRLLPGLESHHCSLGQPGGFVQRLEEGTRLGHVVEHVALELQSAVGLKVAYGKTRRLDPGGRGLYEVVFETLVGEAGGAAGRAAVNLVDGLARGERVDELVSQALTELGRILSTLSLGPSTAALVEAARARGIPVLRLGPGSLLQLGYGRHRRRLWATLTDRTSCLAADLAKDKVLSKLMLSRAGIPVPEGGVASTVREALDIAARLGGAVAVKPYNGNQGKGVSLNLSRPEDVRAAFELAASYSDRVVVERYIPGRHYRVLVVGDRAVAASERIPARVVGDGRASVRELVDRTNRDPLRGEGHERPLTRIRIDALVLMVLARQNLTLDYVPAPGEVVYLRQNANLSTGGTAADATAEMHPQNARLAVSAARVVGLDVAGIDLVAPSLSEPVRAGQGAVIEVNACPGIRMHHYPSKGQPRDAAGAIVDHLFPTGTESRVPVVAVTGTNGKTTTVRLIAHILAGCGLAVGASTTDGVYLRGERVVEGDQAGWEGARRVLEDPEVEAAVLEVARGGLLRSGLAFDRCDVGVALNVAPDHLGQSGVEDLDDLAWVKSLVVEAVAAEGAAVLNADDPRVAAMAARTRARPVFFSLNPENPVVLEHLGRGGTAFTLSREGNLVALGPQAPWVLIAADAVPLSFGGRCRENLQNALAAAAAALALGIPPEAVARGLQTFLPDHRFNPGRFNLVRVGETEVMVDYGHNPEAIAGAARLARRLCPSGRLVGVVGVPGDRRDDTIRAAGRAAGRGFDWVVVREDRDRRGRRPGEVARLLAQGAMEAGLSPARLRVVLEEEVAVPYALGLTGRDGLAVVFFEDYGAVTEVLARARRSAEAPPLGAGITASGCEPG
ncbi:MAG: cyanophycin synthetase [Acetobacteraceae bacterium]|nr:cyanophycin synthetase [Acetobacteraceae bacterium]